MEARSVPGVAIAVVSGGEEETAGHGVTSIENPLEVTPDTLFQIGSIGKTFTATAIMRLVEQGKVELDVPVRTYLPDFRLADDNVAATVTIRHLLTHTGGWEGDYFDDFGLGDDALARMAGRLEELPQLTPLGEVWAYNNAGFYVAGRVIEVVTADRFEDVMKGLVLEPLRLEQAFYFTDDAITRRFVMGHELDEHEETIVSRPWAVGRSANPAGGLITTARDLLRYARFWIEGGELLRPESVQEMLRPQVQVGGSVGGRRARVDAHVGRRRTPDRPRGWHEGASVLARNRTRGRFRARHPDEPLLRRRPYRPRRREGVRGVPGRA